VEQMGFKSRVKGWGNDRWRVKTGLVMRWCVQNEVNQEESEQDEVDGMKKGADSTGKVKVMHI